MGVLGASGVMGVGSAVFFNTVGRVVRVMPWWVSLGGTAFWWTQHSVLVALSCRPSGVMCLMTVRSAWVMFPWGDDVDVDHVGRSGRGAGGGVEFGVCAGKGNV